MSFNFNCFVALFTFWQCNVILSNKKLFLQAFVTEKNFNYFTFHKEKNPRNVFVKKKNLSKIAEKEQEINEPKELESAGLD